MIKLNKSLLLYSLAKTFKSTFDVPLCLNTKSYIDKHSANFSDLQSDEKIYYVTYAMKLAKTFIDYLIDITLFETNANDDEEISHDFRLGWGKANIMHISMCHTSININDIIPQKIMKICGFTKNTNICKKYLEEYSDLNEKIYAKINDCERYSELSAKTKHKKILEPFTELVVNTLGKKRKCAEKMYNHLFKECDRIVLKLYKNRFVVYDFCLQPDNVTSYSMKLESSNVIKITFNNGSVFELTLNTNAFEVKENISLKFHTKFCNIDEIFAIATEKV